MGRNVVIVGALDAGIGVATTARFLRDGWNVIGTCEADQVAVANDLTKNENLDLVQVDYLSREGLAPLIKAIETLQVDGLVNVHMLFNMEDPNGLDFDKFEQAVFVNLSAPNFIIHSLKPHFSDGASIAIVTSTEGFIGSFGASAYAATKAAIHNLVKSHANNLGNRNIRCNGVAPGWIGGVMDTDEVFNMSRKITPLGRLGSADEVANVLAFLLSSEASFVNGTVITVDGGYSGVDTIAKYEFESSAGS